MAKTPEQKAADKAAKDAAKAAAATATPVATDQAVPTQVVTAPVAPSAPVKPAPKVDDALQAAWEQFLAKAEADAVKNGTLHVFEAQKANGEFDTIPPSFSHNHGIQVAQR